MIPLLFFSVAVVLTAVVAYALGWLHGRAAGTRALPRPRSSQLEVPRARRVL